MWGGWGVVNGEWGMGRLTSAFFESFSGLLWPKLLPKAISKCPFYGQ